MDNIFPTDFPTVVPTDDSFDSYTYSDFGVTDDNFPSGAASTSHDYH